MGVSVLAPPEYPEQLLRREAAAKRLGISPRTLEAWTLRGLVPSVKLGRRRLYEPAALRAFIAANRKDIAA